MRFPGSSPGGGAAGGGGAGESGVVFDGHSPSGGRARLKVSTGVTQQTTTQATITQAPRPAAAEVPSLSGELQPAVQQLDQAGFKASVAYVPGTQRLGTVVAQTPAGGASAKTGSQVTVNVSSGPNQNSEQTVPNVVGRRIPQTVSTLNQSGLRLILPRSRVGDRSKARVIVAQAPLPGKSAPKNAQVLVYMGAYQQ
jgi:beta-lactam-binding protein with PASTA domain